MVRSTWIGICSNARTPPQSIFTALHSKENGSGVWRDNEAASALSRSARAALMGNDSNTVRLPHRHHHHCNLDDILLVD